MTATDMKNVDFVGRKGHCVGSQGVQFVVEPSQTVVLPWKLQMRMFPHDHRRIVVGRRYGERPSGLHQVSGGAQDNRQ